MLSAHFIKFADDHSDFDDRQLNVRLKWCTHSIECSNRLTRELEKKPRQIYEVFLWFSTPDFNTAAVCICCVLAIFWVFKIFHCLLMEAKIVKFINFKSNSFIYKSSWYVWFGSSYRYSKWYSLHIFNKGFFLEPIDFGYNSQFYSFFNPFLSLQMGFWRLQQITTYVIVS